MEKEDNMRLDIGRGQLLICVCFPKAFIFYLRSNAEPLNVMN